MNPAAEPRPNTAEVRVGRLLELRAWAGYRSASDVDELFDTIDARLGNLGLARKVVIVVDWRQCPIMAPEAADRVLKRMIALNPHVERSAALGPGNNAPVALLQFIRLIKQSHFPDRKLFYDAEELAGWLREVLTPLEHKRVAEFLREGSGVRSEASLGAAAQTVSAPAGGTSSASRFGPDRVMPRPVIRRNRAARS